MGEWRRVFFTVACNSLFLQRIQNYVFFKYFILLDTGKHIFHGQKCKNVHLDTF